MVVVVLLLLSEVDLFPATIWLGGVVKHVFPSVLLNGIRVLECEIAVDTHVKIDLLVEAQGQ